MKHITTLSLIYNIMKRRAFRTISLILLITFFTFFLFGGTVLTQSINKGIETLTGRFGADLMIVPKGYDVDIQNSILSSVPSTFYLDGSLEDKISAVAGIEIVSPQFFIASLNASCCSSQVQIIGFDQESDFIIKPWIRGSYDLPLQPHDVIAGSLVYAENGGEIYLYGQPFHVAGVMDTTGMGFDSTVFMSMETAKEMIILSETAALHPAGSASDEVSAYFIKLEADADSAIVIEDLSRISEDIVVIQSNDMIRRIGGRLSDITAIVYLISGLLWLMSVFSLFIVFSIMINERRREYALLRALGTNRNKLVAIIVSESVIISAVGALCGIIIACLIVFPFRLYIATTLNIPYLNPSAGLVIVLLIVTFLIAIFTGLIASLGSAVRVSRMDTNSMIREN